MEVRGDLTGLVAHSLDGKHLRLGHLPSLAASIFMLKRSAARCLWGSCVLSERPCTMSEFPALPFGSGCGAPLTKDTDFHFPHPQGWIEKQSVGPIVFTSPALVCSPLPGTCAHPPLCGDFRASTGHKGKRCAQPSPPDPRCSWSNP